MTKNTKDIQRTTNATDNGIHQEGNTPLNDSSSKHNAHDTHGSHDTRDHSLTESQQTIRANAANYNNSSDDAPEKVFIHKDENQLAIFIANNDVNNLQANTPKETNTKITHSLEDIEQNNENRAKALEDADVDEKELEEKNVSYLDPEDDPCNTAFFNGDFVHPADRADQLESLSFEKQLCMLTHMDTEDAAEAIAELDGTAARDLIENLDAEDAAKILSAMDPDDAVDVLDEVEEGHRNVLLNNLAPEEAMELRALLTFDPDTAAGVMNTEIIIISQDESVDDAIHHIRLELEDKDMPYYVYAVDDYDKLVGIISLRELMLSKPGTFIKELLSEKRNLITAEYDLDKVEVARILSHYNFLALPVVDKEGHLMGAVTHDDVIDIIQENASSDLLGMVGAGQDEDIYTPWTKSVKLRLPWLFINMLNSSISAYIVYLFEGSIAQMAFLAVLMPMIANQAGNTGQQALAVMIRQLATEKFDNKKSWKAVFRESKIGFTTGLIVAFLSILIVWGITNNPTLGYIMGASLMLDMLLGSIAGGSIPLILRALGRDPAQASSIFLTAITDGAGFFIFLSFATIFVL